MIISRLKHYTTSILSMFGNQPSKMGEYVKPSVPKTVRRKLRRTCFQYKSWPRGLTRYDKFTVNDLNKVIEKGQKGFTLYAINRNSHNFFGQNISYGTIKKWWDFYNCNNKIVSPGNEKFTEVLTEEEIAKIMIPDEFVRCVTSKKAAEILDTKLCNIWGLLNSKILKAHKCLNGQYLICEKSCDELKKIIINNTKKG